MGDSRLGLCMNRLRGHGRVEVTCAGDGVEGYGGGRYAINGFTPFVLLLYSPFLIFSPHSLLLIILLLDCCYGVV